MRFLQVDDYLVIRCDLIAGFEIVKVGVHAEGWGVKLLYTDGTDQMTDFQSPELGVTQNFVLDLVNKFHKLYPLPGE